jgi:predicted ester cyclase
MSSERGALVLFVDARTAQSGAHSESDSEMDPSERMPGDGAIAMSRDELKIRARRIAEELLTQGDLAVADELLDPDCSYHASSANASGVGGVKSWVVTLRRSFPDLRAMVEEEIAEGDTVVQRLMLSGTHEGVFCGVEPTGRHVAWDLVAILHVGPDAKFTNYRSIWDQLGVLRQLGADPTTTKKSA